MCHPITRASVGDTNALAKRYWWVIEMGYEGLLLPMSFLEEDETRKVGVAVIVNGNVPDPNVGWCPAGSFFGNDECAEDSGCTEAVGSWGSYQGQYATSEFRGGKLVNQGGPSTTCQWPELVPSSIPNQARCGNQCFIPAKWGATCPRYDWLSSSAGCVGSQPQ